MDYNLVAQVDLVKSYDDISLLFAIFLFQPDRARTNPIEILDFRSTVLRVERHLPKWGHPLIRWIGQLHISASFLTLRKLAARVPSRSPVLHRRELRAFFVHFFFSPILLMEINSSKYAARLASASSLRFCLRLALDGPNFARLRSWRCVFFRTFFTTRH